MSEELELKVKIDGKDAVLTFGEAEIEKIIEFHQAVLDARADAQEAKMLRKAAEICVKAQACTTALLQRGLRIGYGRAASLIDKLEAKGIVGSNPGGNTPRKVLISNMDEYKD